MTQASSSGSVGGVGATWLRACSPTRVAASAIAFKVSRLGRPCQRVSGKTRIAIAQTSATALVTVASTRLRRSSAHAIRAETSARDEEPVRRGVVLEHPRERERRGGREEERGDERDQTLRTS